MRHSCHIFFLPLCLLVASCFGDVEAPRNAPDMPTIKSSDLTRVAVTLTGTYPTGADVTEYGFQWSQDGFETYKTEKNPQMTDERTFSWTPTFLTPSTSYLFRSYISNGISTRYSTNLSVKTEATSRATLKDVTIRDGYVSASIVDSGGREIVDIGFLCAETNDMAVLKRSKRHWVEMGTGETFSKSLSSFDPPLEPGKTYYFIAYAEDETDAFGYSPNPQRYDVSVDDMVRFEDDNFGDYVIRHYDTNRDGYISYGEIEGIPLIDVITDNITSVREIRLMPHLRYLSCAGSAIGAGLLTRLDVSGNPELTSLVCDYNKLDSLTVSATPKLDTLSCAGNHLSELLVNDLQSLTWLSCSDNDLDQVDVSYNASLRYLDVSGGRLSMLAIADKTELEELLCRNNHFASLDISHNARLKKLDCAGNMLPALNISDNRSLAYLDCRDNPADTLYLFANQKVETLLKPDAMQLFYLIEGLSLDPEVLTIQVDETATLKPVIVPEDAIDKTVAWACSNDNVATVSDKGIVTGLSVDTCTILATCGGKTAFCHVTVNPVPVASIELDQNAPEILLDETLILHATVLPANATDKTVTWSSSDETVATVSETGVVTAVATGTCEITAFSGGKTATAHLTVSPIPVAEVLLNHSGYEIMVKESFQLEATVLPENATDKTVTWSSSNEEVATVSDGYVIGVSVGECIITAQAGKKSASCRVTVNPIPVSEIILSDTSIELLIGGSQNLTATVLPDDASDKRIVWESSDSRIAKVSNDGVVTAVGVGSCSIHAKSGEVTATCSVTSKAIHVTSIEIIPTECELVVGDSQELTATVLPGNATYKTVYWESSDEEIATVSQNGVVTAMGEGYCRILASADGLSAQCEVAVSPLIIEVTSVTLDATSLAMTTGDTYTLTATVVPSDATDPTVSWTSSDKSVATVSGGTVRAVGAGTCNITAKAGAKSATCHVTVADAVVAVTSVTLNESTLTLTEGNTATLSATVLPDNATDKTVTWTSDDTNIASVSSSGLVTALAAGSCNITARAGTESAICKVTVNASVVESISTNPSSIVLAPYGGSETINVTASGVWTVQAFDLPGVTLSAYGGTGSAQIILTAPENSGTALSGYLLFKLTSTGVTEKVDCFQAVPKIMEVSPTSLTFIGAGKLAGTDGKEYYDNQKFIYYSLYGTYELHISVDVPSSTWQLLSKPEWLTITLNGSILPINSVQTGEGTITVTADENYYQTARNGFIEFEFSQRGVISQQKVTVEQLGENWGVMRLIPEAGIAVDTEDITVGSKRGKKANFRSIRNTGDALPFFTYECYTNNSRLDAFLGFGINCSDWNSVINYPVGVDTHHAVTVGDGGRIVGSFGLERYLISETKECVIQWGNLAGLLNFDMYHVSLDGGVSFIPTLRRSIFPYPASIIPYISLNTNEINIGPDESITVNVNSDSHWLAMESDISNGRILLKQGSNPVNITEQKEGEGSVSDVQFYSNVNGSTDRDLQISFFTADANVYEMTYGGNLEVQGGVLATLLIHQAALEWSLPNTIVECEGAGGWQDNDLIIYVEPITNCQNHQNPVFHGRSSESWAFTKSNGLGQVQFFVEPNTTGKDRSTTLTVHCDVDDLDKTLTLLQHPFSWTAPFSKSYYKDGRPIDGSIFLSPISPAGNYSWYSGTSSESWCIVRPGVSNGVGLSLEENTTGVQRSCTVTVHCSVDDTEQTVTIIQETYNP